MGQNFTLRGAGLIKNSSQSKDLPYADSLTLLNPALSSLLNCGGGIQLESKQEPFWNP